MKPIFTRTMERCIRPFALVFAVVIAMIASAVVGNAAANDGNSSFNGLLTEACLYQHLIVFFALANLFIIVIIASNASGIIANEVHEGTFRLLAAKPNSRQEILLAKILGTTASTILLYAVTLLLYYAMLLTYSLDADIYKGLITYFFSYLVYGLILIFVINGVTTLLSCVFKKKIGAMLPILLILVLMVGFFPIYRTVGTLSSSDVTSGPITWVDMNYHFALIFDDCVELCGKLEVGSSTQASVVSMLTNLFSSQSLDPDVVRSAYSYATQFNGSLNRYVILIVYLVIASGCYVGSFELIKRKDV